MFFVARGLLKPSYGVSIALYVVGISLAVVVTGLGAYRVVAAVMAELAPTRSALTLAAVSKTPPQLDVATRQSPVLSTARQSFMTPLRAGFPGLIKSPAASLPRTVEAAFFGSSSRNWGGSSRRDRDSDEDDDEDRPKPAGTYRTMCVRLCDGYYFPISFSATRDRFARDAKTCESSCGGQARLFVYRNPGADVVDMVDLRGQPYRQLSTAFLYRTEYVPACRCKPNPWDAEAQERHRTYALAVAKRKGSKQAAAELAELTAKMKRDRSSRQPAQPPQVASTADSPVTSPALLPDTGKVSRNSPERGNRGSDKAGRMGLGANPRREARERTSRTTAGNSDWMARALGRSF